MHVMYLVKADETLQHVAKRFGVRPAGIIDGKNLRAPYTIHEGQTLSIPLQSDGRRFMLPPFPRRLAPGRIDPDTRRLQRLLKQTGCLDPSITESDHYGPQTCQAVARLNREHLLGQSPAPDDDPRITHKAWDTLHRLAKGTESP
ncbi:LysM peptidoglycan-binding domain-containing protein [Streptomyces sp. NBC_00490]|uniref:LysM peptidoglycan-binding domain-containing protein n=1 Tax=Streptomyces sp. NBC_00490 TaxID=2903657 RepID=UPI002E191A54